MKPTSFSERMAEAKELAQVARNRGKTVGAHKSHKRRRDGRPMAQQRADWHAYLVDRELYALAEYFNAWRDAVQLAHAAVDIALFGESDQ